MKNSKETQLHLDFNAGQGDMQRQSLKKLTVFTYLQTKKRLKNYWQLGMHLKTKLTQKNLKLDGCKPINMTLKRLLHWV